MKNLKSVIYLSDSETTFSEYNLSALTTQAIESNTNANITGFLCFKENRFLQFIEGPKNEIDQLILRLQLDKRHNILLLLENDNAEKRQFLDWDMYLLDSRNVNEREISYMLYENMDLLLDREAISETLESLIWQSIEIVAQHHKFTKVYGKE